MHFGGLHCSQQAYELLSATPQVTHAVPISLAFGLLQPASITQKCTLNRLPFVQFYIAYIAVSHLLSLPQEIESHSDPGTYQIIYRGHHQAPDECVHDRHCHRTCALCCCCCCLLTWYRTHAQISCFLLFFVIRRLA